MPVPEWRSDHVGATSYKVQRALGVKFGSVFDFNILGITKPSQVKKINSTTFQMKMPAPSPIFGPMLRDQDAGIVDSALVKANATKADPWGTKWLARTGKAATGAYLISEYVPGTKLTLTANPKYWAVEAVLHDGGAPGDPVVAEPGDPAPERLDHIAEEADIDDAVRLKGTSGVKVVSAPTIAQNMLGFVSDKKPFDDVRVRQAVAYAIPYDNLVKGPLRGEAKVAAGVWPRNSIWFQKKAPWPYKYNPTKAKALLAEAGYNGDLSFTVQIRDGDADGEALAIAVKTALSDVGAEMKIQKLSAAEFQKNRSEKTPQAWIESNLGSFVDDPYYQTFLWYGTKSVINWFKYSNPVVDKSFTQFSKVLPTAKRNQLALAVQTQLNKDVPLISLGEPNFLLPVRSDIAGVVYEPDALLAYRYLWRK